MVVDRPESAARRRTLRATGSGLAPRRGVVGCASQKALLSNSQGFVHDLGWFVLDLYLVEEGMKLKGGKGKKPSDQRHVFTRQPGTGAAVEAVGRKQE